MNAADWSREVSGIFLLVYLANPLRKLRANVDLEASITYWNLLNSHWEPLIDPWEFSVRASPHFSSDGYPTDHPFLSSGKTSRRELALLPSRLETGWMST